MEVAGWDLESQSVGFWFGLLITREPLKQFRSCLQWRHSVFVLFLFVFVHGAFLERRALEGLATFLSFGAEMRWEGLHGALGMAVVSR